MKGQFRILIGVWGNPEIWKEVKYSYRGEEVSSPSSYAVIHRLDKPDLSVVVMSDTIVDSYMDCSYYTVPKDYREIVEVVSEKTRSIARRKFGVSIDRIIVGYGVGEFSHFVFRGSADDFYYKVLYELSRIFEEIMGQGDDGLETLEVLFDITHGINFTTVMTYRALYEILRILAYGYDVRLKVLNSDPYISSVRPELLNINVIEDSQVIPGLEILSREDRFFLFDDAVNIEERQYLGRIVNERLGRMPIKKNFFEYRASVAAFKSGMPHYAFSFAPAGGEMGRALGELLAIYESMISVKEGECKFRIHRKLRFSDRFSILVKSYIVSDIIGIHRIPYEEGVPLSSIEQFDRKFLQKNLPVESNRLNNELNHLKELEEHIPRQWTPYVEIRERFKGEEYSRTLDKRNFFAHAGFEYNSIEVKREGNEILVRPSSEPRIREKIIDYLNEVR